ncbi:response regulator [Spirosoma rhododendri]|uniref:Response regulator n=1 Tax=Spirosoma rhododendri TaxID=2728024 RepID=A0A7L5DY55_9BACT|nr:response regulator [Spirosoma rhododendri]QJD81558.1 response regulator [Spirosoma rhododendri]
MTNQQLITVLIIDDDADDRFFMEHALKTDSAHTRLYLADSGQQALDMLVLVHPAPDVILLDLNMPGLSGLEVLGQLKQSTRYQHIPVIVLTTSHAPADRERAYQLGASGFITKPTTQQGLSAIAKQIRLQYAV